MTIEYLEPLARAWHRMVAILFQPFKLEKWLVIGFAAWLAGLAGGNSGGIGWNIGDGWNDDDSSWRIEEPVEAVAVPAAYQRAQLEELERSFDFLPLALGCIAILIPVAIAIGVLLLWLSSRGMFIFLDNLVLDRAAIVEPWKRHARRANSLFVWRLIFLLVVLVGVAIGAVGIYFAATGDLGWVLIAPIVLCLILWALVAALTEVYLRHFVVPLMYRHDLSATDGWRRFLPLLRGHPLQFIGYAVLLLLLWILAAIAIVLVGFLTCCIGFLLLAIPYVGTVLLLPLLVLFRLFSLEFLRQFGPDVDLLAPPPPAAEAV